MQKTADDEKTAEKETVLATEEVTRPRNKVMAWRVRQTQRIPERDVE
jgi:glutaminase